MTNVDNIAQALFDKIRTGYDDLSLGDENAKATQDPEQARFFNFTYAQDNQKLGSVTISLADQNSLKVYFSRDMSDELQDDQKRGWYNFLRDLRKFARSRMMSFDVRDINKSGLDLQDVRHLSKSDTAYDSAEVKMSDVKESAVMEGMHGTRRRSYQEMKKARIIVRHENAINPEVRGARSRNIESIFVETELGERLLMPFKSLVGARAMAQHLQHGGDRGDALGEHIVRMVNEMGSLRGFVRNMRGRTFEDGATTQMVEAAIDYYGQIHSNLSSLAGGRGYKKFAETFQPSATVLTDEVDLESFKEKFVRKIYDERLDAALPIVARVYNERQNSMSTPESLEFESFMDGISEGTYALPRTDEDIKQLNDLLQKPLELGVDGTDAINALEPFLSDSDLDDLLAQRASEPQGHEQPANDLIFNWIEDRHPELYNKLTPPQPAAAPVPASQSAVAPTPAVAPAAPQESVDRYDAPADLMSDVEDEDLNDPKRKYGDNKTDDSVTEDEVLEFMNFVKRVNR
jgi:hypothetical protein